MAFNPFNLRTYVRVLVGAMFLLAWWQVSAQAPDSLEAALARENNIAKRIELLKAVGEAKMNVAPTDAIVHFEELVQLSEAPPDKLLRAFALNRIGNCWFNLNDLRQSIAFYFQALEATDNTAQFNEIRARAYNNLGWSFRKLEEYEKALQYFTESEAYARQVGAKGMLALILNNKGVTQKDLKKLDEALRSLDESLQLNREIGNKRQERFNLNNMAVILIEKNKLSDAVERLQQVLIVNAELRDTVELVNNLQNLASAYTKMDEYAKAERAFYQAVKLAELSKNADAKREMLSELSVLYREQGKFEQALSYFNQFFKLSDSLQRQETRRFALDLEGKYNSVVRERELETARKELAEQQLYLTLIVGALILAVVVVIFFFRMIVLKRRNERILIDLNHEIEAQSEELRQANEEILAINDNLEKLVAERTEVIRNQNERLRQFAFMNAHKIRGPVASILGIVNLMADGRNEKISQELVTHLHTSATKLDKIIHEVSQQLDADESEADVQNHRQGTMDA